DDRAYGIQQTTDGSYIVAGYSYSLGAGLSDFYLVKTGPEKPYHLTVRLDALGTNAILRWMAPQTCDYNIYSTTSATAGEPPSGWMLEATLYDIPGGPAEWTDPAGFVTYKRYAITMSCP
ncbi:MAG: hypothetical protein FJY66_05665, partial [Calditrichaeota bacterium]|nr:hypothetical protein [Calditrichota bacterium]